MSKYYHERGLTPIEGVVMISKEVYEQLRELEYLQMTGTLDTVLKRMADETKADFDDRDAY
ncbi:hypothetical protein [Levilactobacillus yiduensis]|uniref:hypothetical protein n=1 Tax=Levilactobacillus yiduensis TaxID=2953880 RepID=UPI00215761E8|nr:hypothetical protein [Levilactobacillus yiduensis]